MRQYFWNILLLIDCAVDSILFLSSPFETISSRLWRHDGIWWIHPIRLMVDWVALHVFGQADHCRWAAQPEEFYKGYEIIK